LRPRYTRIATDGYMWCPLHHQGMHHDSQAGWQVYSESPPHYTLVSKSPHAFSGHACVHRGRVAGHPSPDHCEIELPEGLHTVDLSTRAHNVACAWMYRGS
jgi:hypothetical protein